MELGSKNIRSIMNMIKRILGIPSLYNTNGQRDCIAEIEVISMIELNYVIAKIRPLEGGLKSETFIILGMEKALLYALPSGKQLTPSILYCPYQAGVILRN